MVRLQARIALAVLVIGGIPAAEAQQNAPPQQKVLPPEQRQTQQHYQQWSVTHGELQAQGKKVFDEEMAREKAGDCSSATSTLDFDECYGKALQAAEASLASYESIHHGLMAAPPGPAQTNMPGPAGTSLTPDQLSAEFDHVEQLWRAYRKAACTAALHQFDGGTGGPPFQLQCAIQLTRNHLRELDTIYGNLLHL